MIRAVPSLSGHTRVVVAGTGVLEMMAARIPVIARRSWGAAGDGGGFLFEKTVGGPTSA